MKKLILTLLLTSSIFGFSACTAKQPTQQMTPTGEESEQTVEQSATQAAEMQPAVQQTEYTFTAEQTGQTAFDLLNEQTTIEYTKYDFGMLITAINGLAADNQHFWAFYLNDEFAQQAADQTTLEEGDLVRFVYEEIKEFNE